MNTWSRIFKRITGFSLKDISLMKNKSSEDSFGNDGFIGHDYSGKSRICQLQ